MRHCSSTRRIAVLLVLIQTTVLGGLAGQARGDGTDNALLVWNEAALVGVRNAGGQGTAAVKLGPPMVARALAMVHTCTFDAWAAYDDVAVGTMLGDSLRRPPSERTEANKQEAISFAAFRALSDVMPADVPLYRSVMESYGYDWTNDTTDTTTPAGVGNVACDAVLDFRHADGSNQLGTPPYSDTTGYVAKNPVMDVRQPMDPSTVVDPNSWQPLKYPDAFGNVITPKYIAPHWGNVIPFALESASQFRSPVGPAKYGSVEYVKQAVEVVLINATLDDRAKMISEHWSDGPASELPPGHWNLIAQEVSRRDGNTLDEDVKMFFALTNAVFDAGIAAWDNKRAYDSVRPITAIRYLFNGLKIPAWGGPGQGTQLVDGASWLPYQPTWFPSPPFPEYSSGHSTFSTAAAEILKRFTGSDAYGGSETFAPGSSHVEPGIVPAEELTLYWETFSDAANEAGMSRRYGGIHFEQGDLEARAAGRLVAGVAWERAQDLFAGTV